MASNPPNDSDPIAFLPWWVDQTREFCALLLIAWADDLCRKTVLRSYVRGRGGLMLECQPHLPQKRFLQWLSSEMGLFPGRRTLPDLHEALRLRCLSADQLLILDDAHELSVGCLRLILDLHHHMDDDRQHGCDGVGTNSTFVLSSGREELVRKLDQVPDFWSYCLWRHYGVPLGRKQRAYCSRRNA